MVWGASVYWKAHRRYWKAPMLIVIRTNNLYLFIYIFNIYYYLLIQDVAKTGAKSRNGVILHPLSDILIQRQHVGKSLYVHIHTLLMKAGIFA